MSRGLGDVYKRQALDRLYTALRGAPVAEQPDELSLEHFRKAMDDDFNTAGGLAAMQDCASALNKAKSSADEPAAAAFARALLDMGQVIGVLREDPEDWFKRADVVSRSIGDEATSATGAVEGAGGGLSDADIDAMIEARNQARANKDWNEADRLRDRLADAGISLEDSSEGTIWRRS